MKKILKIGAAALAACVALALCSCENKEISTQIQIDSEALEMTEKMPKNIYFSPYTGSDDNSGLEIGSPVMSIEKAREVAENTPLSDNEEAVILEYLMTVDVKITGSNGVNSDVCGVNMISFTGSVESRWFSGETAGVGCDTQRYYPDGKTSLSARYLLKGRDCDGKNCSIFIENNGPSLDMCTPVLVTDSEALSGWQEESLRAIVVPKDGGVDVNLFAVRE